jgi:hypothetical protein
MGGHVERDELGREIAPLLMGFDLFSGIGTLIFFVIATIGYPGRAARS